MIARLLLTLALFLAAWGVLLFAGGWAWLSHPVNEGLLLLASASAAWILRG